jgi:hypothetical protein
VVLLNDVVEVLTLPNRYRRVMLDRCCPLIVFRAANRQPELLCFTQYTGRTASIASEGQMPYSRIPFE